MNLKSLKHLCCIYSDQDDYRDLISHVINTGLVNNERILLSGDSENISLILNHLKQIQINTNKLISEGQIGLNIFELNNLYSKIVDADYMLHILEREMDITVSNGFKGMRVLHEMSFAIAFKFDTAEIIEYERSVNKYANFKDNCTIFSFFNRNIFSNSAILDITLTLMN